MITTHFVVPAPDDEAAWNTLSDEIRRDDQTGVIYMMNETAEMTVKLFSNKPGIYVRVWQISTSSNGSVIKHKWSNSSVVLSLLYIFNPEFFFFRQSGYNLQLNKPNGPAMLLIPSGAVTRFELASYHNIQLIEIGLTSSFFETWIQGQFLLPVNSEIPLIRLKMCSLPIIAQLKMLYQKATSNETRETEINGLVDFLISSLPTDFTTERSDGEILNQVPGLDKIHELEQDIMANLRNPLPSLQSLAKKVAVSETVLKRHFKTVFGKGIYQYYLFRKMQLARMILEERNISVSTLAEEMGYQKVSHFISQFKKHHGCAPGEMIRNKMKNI